MQLTPTFTSVGVNRVVNTLDWGSNGLIAYGGHWIVCIYDPEVAAVVGTLTGHKGQVNCVKWLPQSVFPPGVSLLLSGAADNNVRVWAWYGQQHNPPWRCITELKAHQSPVTSLAVQELNPHTLLLASTSGDPQLQLWHCHHSAGQRQQQLQQQQADGLDSQFGPAAWQQLPPLATGPQIQHCVAIAQLPEDPGWLVMATGGTDSTVRLFVRGPDSDNLHARSANGCRSEPSSSSSSSSSEQTSQALQQQGLGLEDDMQSGFKLQCQLKGHENWIRGVAFTQVRELGGDGKERVSLLLATAAQDRYGRIWCITTDALRSNSATTPQVPGSGSSSSQTDALRQLITRYAPRPHLSANSSTYWVSLEALLVGHEDWLHTVTWRPAAAAAGAGATASTRHNLMLLTTSQDRSMMLWCSDQRSGLWISEAAVGDAGASCLGFYGGAFSPDGGWLVAHGFTGALHLWQQQQGSPASGPDYLSPNPVVSPLNPSSSSSRRDMHWVPQHALGGHYGAVEDLCWGGDGGCLQSVGTDQTARLFTGCQGHWFELARTQVHGHDFSCLAAIPTTLQPSDAGSSSNSSGRAAACLSNPSVLYVSGSEEKVIRVFEAPQAFFDTLSAIRCIQSPHAAAAVAAAMAAAAAARGSSSADGSRGRALGASVSALGLSNKALYVEDQGDPGTQGSAAGASGSLGFGQEAYNEGPDFVPCATPSVVTDPPLEEHLAQNTLWPEIRKLYGHGNDVYCVCPSPNGRLIASACKAQSAGAAAVWVWEVGSWKAIAQLPGHTLTVTQLEFSPNGQLLLSGSRDRSFSIWRVPETYAAANGSSAADTANNAAAAAAADGGEGCFALVVRLQKAHSRIIWAVSWSHDSRLFATGSRDQTVKLWAVDSTGMPGQKPAVTLPAFSAGVTAVALAPQHASTAAAADAGKDPDNSGNSQLPSTHLLAVGLEDGQVQVWGVTVTQGSAESGTCGLGFAVDQLWVSEPWCQHASVVKRLRWAPAGVAWLCGGSENAVFLASCGEDNSVRVFEVVL